MGLTRDQILEANDLQKESVEVPEWGGSVLVATMSGRARDAWEQSLVAGKGVNMENIRARLVAFTVVDDQGNRMFSDGDVDALGRKSGAALDRVVDVARRLNKLTERDLEDIKGN